MSAKKASKKAAAKKPAARKAATKNPKAKNPAAKRTPPRRERVQLTGLRTLGDVESSTSRAATRSTPTAKKAAEVLQAEFRRALEMKEKLAAESAIGGREKGREATRQQEKMRSIVNSLEGMNRFALQMGLITPAESRELYAQAMKDGLYEGWIR